MTVHELLKGQSRSRARARAARLGAHVALTGAALVAVVLLCERSGIDLPGIWIPAAPPTPGVFEKTFGFLFLSLAGLVQGTILLLAVSCLALIVRRAGPAVLRHGPVRTARSLDRALSTDRFLAAMEAQGVLRDLAQRHATTPGPPGDALAPPPVSRVQRWLTAGAVLLALLVALSPGTAPGGSGRAPVTGDRSPGRERHGLVLKLLGESRTFGPREPVMVQVVAEAAFAPAADLDLELGLLIDGGEQQATNRRLFLAAGAAGEDAVALDLRRFARGLKPGEHVAIARADGAKSNEYRFRIEAPPGADAGGAAPPPKDRPKPDPKGGKDRGADPRYDPKFVEPLVRDGQKVTKRARVPIEVPGGAPVEQTLEQAWPELQRRREAALKRPGLSPRARKLVSEYFERLRPAR